MHSLRTSFHSKSSYQLLVKHTMRLPLVIMASCFRRGHCQPEHEQVGQDSSLLLTHRPEKCSVVINGSKLRKLKMVHLRMCGILS